MRRQRGRGRARQLHCRAVTRSVRTVPPTVLRPGVLAAALAALAACAASEPLDMSMPTPTEQVAVTVLGDGFVRTGDRRIPLELCVLELRQRVRVMDAGTLAGFRVRLDVAVDAGEAAPDDLGRMLDQLQIMGVPWVETR